MIRSKITRLFVIMLMCIPAMLNAQPSPECNKDGKDKDGRWKQIESAKIAFFTTELDLSPEEAQVFWPVYNQYMDELWQVRKDSREAFHKMRDLVENGNCTEKQMMDAITAYIESCKSDDDVQKKYYDKFVALIPVEKVAKMYLAEEDFRHRMIEMFKKPEHDRREGHK